MSETNKSALSYNLLDQTVDALIATTTQHDKTAEGHSQRVTRYSLAIGRVLGLNSGYLKDLRYAASLHDIGKVAISRSILNKVGKLTDDEFAVMKMHSTIAIKILEKVDGFREAVPMIKHHHERFDGKGYPDGISGEQIPIGSRVISIAEAFDILTSDVPWRDVLSEKDAIAEIDNCSGTQFDPEIVAAFRYAVTKGSIEK